jgi:hypothetical protein
MRRLAGALVATAVLAGCAGVPERLPARYVEDGRVHRTTVDSAAARYIVEQGTSLLGDDDDGDARAADGRVARDAGWDRYVAGLIDDPTLSADPERLRTVARTVSVDFATALYRLQVQSRPDNRAFRARIDRMQAALARGERPASPVSATPVVIAGTPVIAPPRPRVRIALVPGWRWRTSPANGADLERVRPVADGLGFPSTRIETDEDGTVEENAHAVAQWLRNAPGDEPIVLVSASKGGPEAALALDALRDTPVADRVVAWINVSGLMGGSAIADGSLAWPARAFVQGLMLMIGGSMRPVESMTQARSRERRDALDLPEHLVVVNYVAAPYSGDITPRGAFTWSFLRPSGPNDGITLLADARMPGITLIEPGVDHFLAGPQVDARLAAILLATLDLVAERRAGRRAGRDEPAPLATLPAHPSLGTR